MTREGSTSEPPLGRRSALAGPGEAFPWQPVRGEGVRLVGEVFQEARARGEFIVGEPDLVDNFLWGAPSRGME